jgi:hypothetical protein
MKYLLIAALLFGCAKEKAPAKDLIIFTGNSPKGAATIFKDGVQISHDNISGAYRFEIDAKPGNYEYFFVSVPPGYSTAYIHHNSTKVAMFEKSHSSRITGILNYTHK